MKAVAVLTLVGASSLSGCSNLPGSGFLRKTVEPPAPDLKGIQFVEVTESVARQLLAQRSTRLFSETLGSAEANTQRMGAGDIVEVTICEAPPATLFSGGMSDSRSVLTLPRARGTLPKLIANKQASITLRFSVQVPCTGRS